MLILSGCANDGRARIEYCVMTSPTWLSKEDKLTKATERKILKDNEIWEALCKK